MRASVALRRVRYVTLGVLVLLVLVVVVRTTTVAPLAPPAHFAYLNGEVYLDYAGLALYTEDQIDAAAEAYKSAFLCNARRRPRA